MKKVLLSYQSWTDHLETSLRTETTSYEQVQIFQQEEVHRVKR